MSRYYTPEGERCTAEEWVRIREGDPSRWRVGYTGTRAYTVSTVALGLDHRYDDGQPMIFETLASAPHTERIDRYATWAEAAAGHERVVRWVRRTAWRRWVAERLLRAANRAGGEWWYA